MAATLCPPYQYPPSPEELDLHHLVHINQHQQRLHQQQHHHPVFAELGIDAPPSYAHLDAHPHALTSSSPSSSFSSTNALSSAFLGEHGILSLDLKGCMDEFAFTSKGQDHPLLSHGSIAVTGGGDGDGFSRDLALLHYHADMTDALRRGSACSSEAESTFSACTHSSNESGTNNNSSSNIVGDVWHFPSAQYRQQQIGGAMDANAIAEIAQAAMEDTFDYFSEHLAHPGASQDSSLDSSTISALITPPPPLHNHTSSENWMPPYVSSDLLAFPSPPSTSTHLHLQQPQQLLHHDLHTPSMARYSCAFSDCTWATDRRDLLKAHLARAHDQAESFACAVEGCGKRFAQFFSLEMHQVQHQLVHDPFAGHGRRQGQLEMEMTTRMGGLGNAEEEDGQDEYVHAGLEISVEPPEMDTPTAATFHHRQQTVGLGLVSDTPPPLLSPSRASTTSSSLLSLSQEQQLVGPFPFGSATPPHSTHLSDEAPSFSTRNAPSPSQPQSSTSLFYPYLPHSHTHTRSHADFRFGVPSVRLPRRTSESDACLLPASFSNLSSFSASGSSSGSSIDSPHAGMPTLFEDEAYYSPMPCAPVLSTQATLDQQQQQRALAAYPSPPPTVPLAGVSRKYRHAPTPSTSSSSYGSAYSHQPLHPLLTGSQHGHAVAQSVYAAHDAFQQAVDGSARSSNSSSRGASRIPPMPIPEQPLPLFAQSPATLSPDPLQSAGPGLLGEAFEYDVTIPSHTHTQCHSPSSSFPHGRTRASHPALHRGVASLGGAGYTPLTAVPGRTLLPLANLRASRMAIPRRGSEASYFSNHPRFIGHPYSPHLGRTALHSAAMTPSSAISPPPPPSSSYFSSCSTSSNLASLSPSGASSTAEDALYRQSNNEEDEEENDDVDQDGFDCSGRAETALALMTAKNTPARRGMTPALRDLTVRRAVPAPIIVTGPNTRLHPCDFEGCDRVFKRLEHKRRHERSHTQEKPYGCDVPGCGRYFSRSDNLTQHKRTHKREGRTRKNTVSNLNTV